MGMGLAPTWLRQVIPPLLHMTTLTTVNNTDKTDYVICFVITSCIGKEELQG